MLLDNFINKQYQGRSSVEYASNRVKAFLTTTVPKLQLQKILFINLRTYSSKFCPKCHLVVMVKGIRTNSIDNARFAYSRIPNRNELESSIKFYIIQCGLTGDYINMIIIQILVQGAFLFTEFEGVITFLVIFVYSFICSFELH